MASLWRLEAQHAELTLGAIQARLDLNRLDQGLVTTSASAAQLPTWWAITPLSGESGSPPLIDAYLRGNDLIAHFDAMTGWPIRLELVWRASEANGANPAQLDFQVSVHTRHLETAPELFLHTHVLANAVLAPASPQSGSVREFSTATTFSYADSVAGFTIGRPANSSLSYVELIHRSDFCGLHQSSAGAGVVHLRNNLFAERLEKGVIRRARLRGLFVNRENDLAAAREAQSLFDASESDLSA